jgi:hypothetical protein
MNTCLGHVPQTLSLLSGPGPCFQFAMEKIPMRPTLRFPNPTPRGLLCLFSAILFTFTAVLAHAQEYTSIVVFGDSLSDTGNAVA